MLSRMFFDPRFPPLTPNWAAHTLALALTSWKTRPCSFRCTGILDLHRASACICTSISTGDCFLFCIVRLRVAAASLLTYNTSHPTHRAHLAPRTPHHAWHRAHRTSHLALSFSHLTYHILQPASYTSHRTMHIAPLTPYHHSHPHQHRHEHHQHQHSRHRLRPHFYLHYTNCSHHAKNHTSSFIAIHRHSSTSTVIGSHVSACILKHQLACIVHPSFTRHSSFILHSFDHAFIIRSSLVHRSFIINSAFTHHYFISHSPCIHYAPIFQSYVLPSVSLSAHPPVHHRHDPHHSRQRRHRLHYHCGRHSQSSAYLSEVVDSSYGFPLQTLSLDYDSEMCFARARDDVAPDDDVNGLW